MKRALSLEHVAFENSANLGKRLRFDDYFIEPCRLFEGAKPSEPSAYDVILIMGGPMNIYEYEKYPWLKEEKLFIEKALNSNAKIIGTCLGAQLTADVLGAKTKKNPEKEIGWFDVKLNPKLLNDAAFGQFGGLLEAFHWHGDTFDIPAGALPLGSSEACDNQGFLYESNVLCTQFHLDYAFHSLEMMIEHCPHEIEEGGKFVQSPEEILNPHKVNMLEKHLNLLLDVFL